MRKCVVTSETIEKGLARPWSPRRPAGWPRPAGSPPEHACPSRPAAGAVREPRWRTASTLRRSSRAGPRPGPRPAVGPRRPRQRPPGLHDRHPAAERDGRAAHGARAQQHASRTCSIRYAPHGRRRDACGSAAPTTPASPPRPWSRRRWPPRASPAQELGREEFVRRVWEWKEEYGGRSSTSSSGWARTLDYERERFTMDEAYARARAPRLRGPATRRATSTATATWSTGTPGCGSAISDLEVEDREVTDTLVAIAYPLADGAGEIVVATVRPETMLGDTAVAVNPDDERYRDLIGQDGHAAAGRARAPDRGRRARASPSSAPAPSRSRPAHDPNDFEIGRRHGLEADQRHRRGRAHDRRGAGAPTPGLTPAECADRVVADLRAQGLLRGEEPYTHTVPFSHRSGARVEPLVSLQWFCDMTALAAPAIAAVEEGRVRFTPAQVGRRLPRLDARDPALVRQPPALVGPPAARSGTAATRSHVGDREPPRARAGSATPTSSTPGSARPCGRSPPSAGRSRPRSCERFYPDPGALDGPRHHLPVGRPDGDDGPRVHGRGARSPTSTSTRSSRRRTAAA